MWRSQKKVTAVQGRYLTGPKLSTSLQYEILRYMMLIFARWSYSTFPRVIIRCPGLDGFRCFLVQILTLALLELLDNLELE